MPHIVLRQLSTLEFNDLLSEQLSQSHRFYNRGLYPFQVHVIIYIKSMELFLSKIFTK